MSKATLKAAMESLQVKTPLRLPSKAPTFQAPPAPTLCQSLGESKSWEPNPSLDQKSSQDLSISLDVPASADVTKSQGRDDFLKESKERSIQTQDADLSQDLGRSPDSESTLDQAASMDLNSSQDSKPSSDSDASEDLHPPAVVPRASQPRRATEQDRAVTEVASASSRLSTGYTRVPNSVLMAMVSGDLSRNEMKLLLLIARMTISFNRPLAPLSKGVIERMTGVQGRAVLDALQSLEKAGRIRKVAGDHKSPNRLGLVYESPFVDRTPDEKRTQDVPASQDQNSASDRKSSPGWDEISPYKKDSFETKNLKREISLSTNSETLQKYFAIVQPKRKRETEFQAFEEIRDDFSEESIAIALRFLQEKGTPGTGSPCHSPMAYLAKAIPQVLPEAMDWHRKRQQSDSYVNARAEEERRQIEREQLEEREERQREQAFNSAYPDPAAQAQVLAPYAARFPMFGAGHPALRKLAIHGWWEEERGVRG